MLSGLYRYNSDLLGLLSDNLRPMQSFEKGYWPIDKKMNYDPINKQKGKTMEVDDLKVLYLRKFISLACEYDIPVAFVASPTYFGNELQHTYDPIIKICKEGNVVFIDVNYDDAICSSKEYWDDATHLNDEGVHLFSKKTQSKLSTILKL